MVEKKRFASDECGKGREGRKSGLNDRVVKKR